MLGPQNVVFVCRWAKVARALAPWPGSSLRSRRDALMRALLFYARAPYCALACCAIPLVSGRKWRADTCCS
eukprot:973330-Rhodomonas_salina.1